MSSITPLPVGRSASESSTLSFSKDICRICHSDDEDGTPLIAPCYCSGSLRFVHQACLQQWIKSSNTKSCELCKFVFIMNSKVKPFNKWEPLQINKEERRKILCSISFHVFTITSVIMSLNVLIQRSAEEVQQGTIHDWPFWTKVIVVAIAFIGSIVFIYVQCRMYIQLCKRWRAYNRVIYIQNAPEKMPLDDYREKTPLSGTSSPIKEKGFKLDDPDKRLKNVVLVSSLEEPCGTISTVLSLPVEPPGSVPEDRCYQEDTYQGDLQASSDLEVLVNLSSDNTTRPMISGYLA